MKEKCLFAKEEVNFLGHRIKDGKLMMDDSKVKVIQEWDAPTKVPQLRSFLGLFNYYQRFIKGYRQGHLYSLIFLRRIRHGNGTKCANKPLRI